MRRLFVGFVLLSLVAAACGKGGRVELLRTVNRSIDRTRTTPHAFVYTEHLLDSNRTIQINGEMQDDFRSSATMSINGKPVLQQVVSDDALAMRVLDKDAVKPFMTAVKRQSDYAAKALNDGKWVIDHQGAPPLVAPKTTASTIAIGADPLIDASTYVYQYLHAAIDQAGAMGEFNPDAIEYNPLDDPFKEDVGKHLRQNGIRRFDTVLVPLPGPAPRGTPQVLPSTFHFRKMAFYLRGSRLLEVKEQIKITDRPEFRRAENGRAAQFFLKLEAAALAGKTRDVIRQRDLDVVLTPNNDMVALPSADAVAVPKMDLIGAVTTMFPEVQRRLELPVGGLPTVSAKPAASAKPKTKSSASPKPSGSGKPAATVKPSASYAPPSASP